MNDGEIAADRPADQPGDDVAPAEDPEDEPGLPNNEPPTSHALAADDSSVTQSDEEGVAIAVGEEAVDIEDQPETTSEAPDPAPGASAAIATDHGGPSAHSTHAKSGAAALTVGALGVVFGDLGTSPLYAMKEAFSGPERIAPETIRIYGVISLIFWALMIVVTIKYVLLLMRFSNDGEGGIMALIALMMRAVRRRPGGKFPLIALGIFGASLFYGDGMITPSITVLSAVEGLKVATPSLDSFVIPIALTILALLFIIQKYGTGIIGIAFGPVMALWFIAIAAFGLHEIVTAPEIVKALSPSYAIQFVVQQPGPSFVALGSVVLAITGAEALYADMGHFGRPAISRAWLLMVLPCLMLQYMGQGALLLRDHSAASNPFFRLIPGVFQLPMVILATLAAVIASQAVISGAFSVTRQAVQLGFLPRLRIIHTSSREMGQIYVPAVNWILFVAVMALVLGFRSSGRLAAAYGIAVMGTLTIDTTIFFVVVHLLFRKPTWMAVAGACCFLVFEVSFVIANVPKIAHGGWFPLLVATTVFTTLMTWRAGRLLLRERMVADELPIADFLAEVERLNCARVPGTAVFLTATGPDTPRSLIQNVEHNRVLHEHVVLFTIKVEGRPAVPDAERLRVTEIGSGVTRIEAHYGFQEVSDIPATLRLAQERGLDIDAGDASYFVNRVSLTTGKRPGLAQWRKNLFRVINLNARDAAEFFLLPADRVVEMGTRIEL